MKNFLFVYKMLSNFNFMKFGLVLRFPIVNINIFDRSGFKSLSESY